MRSPIHPLSRPIRPALTRAAGWLFGAVFLLAAGPGWGLGTSAFAQNAPAEPAAGGGEEADEAAAQGGASAGSGADESRPNQATNNQATNNQATNNQATNNQATNNQATSGRRRTDGEENDTALEELVDLAEDATGDAPPEDGGGEEADGEPAGPAQAIAPGAADAADAADPASPATSITPQAIPAPQIGRRIEETFRELQEIAPRLRRQREVREIRRKLPGFVREIGRQLDSPGLEDLDGLSPRRLLDLEQDWARISGRLEAWQSVLESRGSTLAEERQQVRRSKRLWVLSRDAEREEPLPDSQVQRIGRLLHRIRGVARRLELRLHEVLDLQGELSDQGIRVSSIVARISAARQKARDERRREDHEPLWLGGEAFPDARPEPAPGPLIVEHAESLRRFLVRESSGVALQLIVFLLLGGLLGRIRFQRGPAARRAHAAPLRALRSRPLASAALLALTTTPLAYPYVPSVVRAIVLILMLGALLRLHGFLLPEPRRPFVGLLILSALSIPVALGYTPAPLRRLALVVLPVAGIACAAQLYVAWRRGDPADSWTRALQLLCQLAALPLLLALYYAIVGGVEHSAVLADGAFTVIEMAIVIDFALALATTLLALGTRHRWARLLRTFRNRRRPATRILVGVMRWTGLIALAYAALVGFDELDPLVDSTRTALRRTYEFGSIELSLGDVLAFALVIAGTSVVVRLTHFLLSHELLPRLGLGTGTEAAISLTVSYLLVALGVILAFGLAGVDPEQLALLGGALGVGIGFGLQNVVSNFVSGLILVAERPIKVGDVIEIGELVGQVQRIGIRSSTVRSLNGAEVIVPNAELIAGQLVNWTLSDARRRVDLPVGTSYDADPQDVRDVLERVVRTQPGILQDPPPEVLMIGFGDSAIDFVVRFWTSEYRQAIGIKSRLAQRVHSALTEAGIEIPYPQRDVHIRSEAKPSADAHSATEDEADA